MINITKSIYVGWNNSQQTNPLDIVELIPIGNSTNEKTKLKTFTKKYLNLAEHENIPLPGFTIFKIDKKHYGYSDQKWLVIDPRGFLVKISSTNLESIMNISGISSGLIQQKCIWAREDTQTQMILIPVNSESYKEATKNSVIIENKINIKDVEIGDTVFLQNELTGRYMGVMSLYSTLQPTDFKSNNYAISRSLKRQVVEVSPGLYYYQKDVKILTVVKKTGIVLSKEDAVNEINDNILNGIANFTQHKSLTYPYYFARGLIKHVSLSSVENVKLSFEEISLDLAVEVFNQGRARDDIGMLAVEDFTGTKYLIDHVRSKYLIHKNLSANINSFIVYNILSNTNNKDITSVSVKPSTDYYTLSNFIKFFKIIKHVKDQTYI